MTSSASQLTMICQGCSATYDPSFEFCPHCGRANPEPTTAHVELDEVKWETCQIRRESRTTDEKTEHGGYKTIHWWEASQPTAQGLVVVAKSDEYVYPFDESSLLADWSTSGKVLDHREAKTQEQREEGALSSLVSRLIEMGWETTANEKNHVTQMRRRAS